MSEPPPGAMKEPLLRPDMERLRFVVVGAGAIGGFVGAMLHDAGYGVRFLVRGSARSRAQRELLSKVGLTALCSADPNFAMSIDAQDVPGVFTEDVSACLAGCACVFVATKRTENAAVHRQLVELGVECPVVFLQNGLRVCEDLSPRTYEAVESVVDFNVVYDARAGTVTMTQAMEDATLVLDGRQPGANAIAGHLARCPVKVVVDHEFAGVQCGKLLLNLTNAVNALSGLHIAPMLMQAPYRQVLAASMKEAQAVYAASGLVPKPAKAKDKLMLKWFVSLLQSPQVVFAAVVGRKLKGRGAGYTSMAQDLLARQVPTEIDFLNGEIVQLGRSCGVPTPVNERLIALVKEAEAANAGCPGLSGRDLAEAVGVPAGGGRGPLSDPLVISGCAALAAAAAAVAARGLYARL